MIASFAVAVLLWVRAVSAGCPTDPDRDERRAHAPLVAIGVVVGVGVVDAGDPGGTPTVLETVKVTQVLKGTLDRPGLRLRTWAPTSGSCGSARVIPLGGEVYVIDAPDADGTVTVSGCTGDVGELSALDGRAALTALAAQHPESAGHFAGVDVAAPAAATVPLPRRDGLRARVRRDGALVDAALLATPAAPGVAPALVDDDGLWFREDVPLADLQPVTVGRTPVRRGAELSWRAGLPFADATHVVGAPGLTIHAPLPADALGDRWRDEPTVEPVDERWRVVTGAVALFDGKAGAPLVTTSADGELWVRDPGGTGWRPIEVRSPELTGRAWVHGELATVDGGTVGGMVGSSPRLREVTLDRGDTLRDPHSGVVFAEAARRVQVVELDPTGGHVLAAVRHRGAWRVGEVLRAE